MDSIYRQVKEFLDKGETVAVATIVSTRGSTPREIGAKMVVTAWGEILGTIAQLVGRRAPRLRLPPGLLLPLAHLAETAARLRGGREPLLTTDGLRMARKRMYFSSALAERELGFRARPALEALRDALDWYRRHGYL